MGELDTIGVITLGKAGRSCCGAITRIASEIQCKELYLTTRSKSNLEEVLAEIDKVKTEVEKKRAEKGHTEPYPAPEVKESTIDEIIEKECKLVIISSAQDFGYGLKAGDDRNYLKQEREKRAEAKKQGRWTDEKEKDYKNAEKLYRDLKAALKKKGWKKKDFDANFRIFYSIPYNLTIIKNLAKKFKERGYKGKVCMLTNPIDIMNYVFALYSGVEDVFGCNEYEPFRERNKFDEVKEFLKIRGVIVKGYVTVLGEHGPDIVPVIRVEPILREQKNRSYDILHSAMRALDRHFEKELNEMVKGRHLSREELNAALEKDSLQDYLRLWINAYVEQGVVEEPEKIQAETEPVIETMLRNLAKGGDSVLSMVNKLSQLIDDDEMLEQVCEKEGNWSEYKGDKGISIGGGYSRRRGEFKQVAYSLSLEECISFVTLYRKHHDILEILRKIKTIDGGPFIEGFADVGEFEKVEPPYNIPVTKKDLTLDEIAVQCKKYFDSKTRPYERALLLLSDYTYGKGIVDVFLEKLTSSSYFDDLKEHRWFDHIGIFISAMVNKIAREDDLFEIDLRNLDTRIHCLGMKNTKAHYKIRGKLGHSTGWQMEGGKIEIIDDDILPKWGELKEKAQLQVEGLYIHSWKRLLSDGDYTVLDNTGGEQSGGEIIVEGVERDEGARIQKGGIHRALFIRYDGGEFKEGGDLFVECAYNQFCKGMKGGFAEAEVLVGNGLGYEMEGGVLKAKSTKENPFEGKTGGTGFIGGKKYGEDSLEETVDERSPDWRKKHYLFDTGPNKKRAEQYLKLGRAYYDKGDIKKAAECFEKVIEIYPNDPMCHAKLSKSYEDVKDYDKAMEFIKKAIALNPCRAFYHFRLGDLHDRKGSYSDAEKAFEKAMELVPSKDIINFSFLISNRFNIRERYDDLRMKWLEKAIELDPEEPASHYQLSEIYQRKEKPKEADEHTKLADELVQKIKDEEIKKLEGEIKQAPPGEVLGEPKEEIPVEYSLEKKLLYGGSESETPLSIKNLAAEVHQEILEEKQKQRDTIRDSTRDAARDESRDAARDVARGAARDSASKTPKELLEEKAEKYFELGRAYFYKGDLDNAEKAFGKILEICPDNPNLYVELSDFYKERIKDCDKAMELLKKAVEFESGSRNERSDRHYELGRLYDEKGEYDNARDCFEKAMEVALPINRAVYAHFIGEFMGRREEYDDLIIKWLKETIESIPEDKRSYKQLAEAYKRKRMPKETVECAKKAEELEQKMRNGEIKKLEGEIEHG